MLIWQYVLIPYGLACLAVPMSARRTSGLRRTLSSGIASERETAKRLSYPFEIRVEENRVTPEENDIAVRAHPRHHAEADRDAAGAHVDSEACLYARVAAAGFEQDERVSRFLFPRRLCEDLCARPETGACGIRDRRACRSARAAS